MKKQKSFWTLNEVLAPLLPLTCSGDILTCNTSSLDWKSDLIMSLLSVRRVIATARRPLASWCASEGRCFRKITSNQLKILIEGFNGPSVKAFICLTKCSISSRIPTVKQKTLSQKQCYVQWK